MKRLLLGSLLSCMLVGQVSCDMQENCVNMSKGALNAGAKIAGSAFLGATLGMIFANESKDVYRAAGGFAVLSAMWCVWSGVARIEKATDLNAVATDQAAVHARNGWFGGGETLGAFASCALIAYLSKKKSN